MLDLLGVAPAPARAADAAVDAVLMNLTTMAPKPLSFFVPTSPIFLPALITLLAAYHAFAPLFPSARQRSWILSTIASFLMTASSIPFVVDYVWRGGVQGVQGRAEMGETVNRFFQAYLTADMLLGFLCYRSQIGFPTGWIHHVVYIGFWKIAVRCGWAHIFCLAAVMERLPPAPAAVSISTPDAYVPHVAVARVPGSGHVRRSRHGARRASLCGDGEIFPGADLDRRTTWTWTWTRPHVALPTLSCDYDAHAVAMARPPPGRRRVPSAASVARTAYFCLSSLFSHSPSLSVRSLTLPHLQLPTFPLGASTPLPALRSNAFFAVTFFATRICSRLALMGSYAMYVRPS
ncbi:hypothetical protein B0H14DRAFT_3882508 [Mycena olivaceomarginata]|nr:hypothetical protein B0H14DRAFT_3882508 [Mycena olivaceomarginata]